MNNLDASVQGDASSPEPPVDAPIPAQKSWARRRWWVVVLVTTSSAVVAVVAWSLITSAAVVIETPGNLYTTADRIAVTGAQTYPTDDRIDLVTVTLDTRVSKFEEFYASHFDDDAIITKSHDILGNQTPAQNDELNALLMSQSKDAAVLVALQRLGYDVHPTATGAVIEQTEPHSPADGALRIAETIVEIDGQAVASPDDVHTIMAPHKPGDHVTLTVEATDKTRHTVDITLAENKDKPGTPFIGVLLTARLAYPALPVTVTITSGGIGGPSAGLAFTLGILDFMTPGDLTGGHEVAATGTIESDGTVGEIGGIESKVVTVARQHVKYFLVPVKDADAARAKAPSSLQIVAVANLDEALRFLQSIGGSGLPAPSTSSGT